ncbi:MAG: hypothetical protein ACR2JD_07120 [Nocardioides sp.]
MAEEELERTEIEAVLETRRELGLQYDAALVDGFADRIERALDKRVSEELVQRKRADAAVASAGPRQLALGIISLVACIPISIPLGLQGQYPALLIVLLAIVAVNYAHAWQSKR